MSCTIEPRTTLVYSARSSAGTSPTATSTVRAVRSPSAASTAASTSSGGGMSRAKRSWALSAGWSTSTVTARRRAPVSSRSARVVAGSCSFMYPTMR
jgi:hypothetical protein